jgi:predicted component of type VI protein secretion system
VVSFHSTSDARKALEFFDGVDLNGLKLDLQVPERFRCDVDATREARRASGSRYGLRDSFSRQQYSRNNSIRTPRTVSNGQGETIARRTSIFSPQDARSDLPDLIEAPTYPATPAQNSQMGQEETWPQKSEQISPKRNNSQHGKKENSPSKASQKNLSFVHSDLK